MPEIAGLPVAPQTTSHNDQFVRTASSNNLGHILWQSGRTHETHHLSLRKANSLPDLPHAIRQLPNIHSNTPLVFHQGISPKLNPDAGPVTNNHDADEKKPRPDNLSFTVSLTRANLRSIYSATPSSSSIAQSTRSSGSLLLNPGDFSSASSDNSSEDQEFLVRPLTLGIRRVQYDDSSDSPSPIRTYTTPAHLKNQLTTRVPNSIVSEDPKPFTSLPSEKPASLAIQSDNHLLHQLDGEAIKAVHSELINKGYKFYGFHGTTQTALESIVPYNFDPSHLGEISGLAKGPGFYASHEREYAEDWSILATQDFDNVNEEGSSVIKDGNSGISRVLRIYAKDIDGSTLGIDFAWGLQPSSGDPFSDQRLPLHLNPELSFPQHDLEIVFGPRIYSNLAAFAIFRLRMG